MKYQKRIYKFVQCPGIYNNPCQNTFLQKNDRKYCVECSHLKNRIDSTERSRQARKNGKYASNKKTINFRNKQIGYTYSDYHGGFGSGIGRVLAHGGS